MINIFLYFYGLSCECPIVFVYIGMKEVSFKGYG